MLVRLEVHEEHYYAPEQCYKHIESWLRDFEIIDFEDLEAMIEWLQEQYHQANLLNRKLKVNVFNNEEVFDEL